MIEPMVTQSNRVKQHGMERLVVALKKDAHCVCVCSGMARRIVVRDMGNGVDRVVMCTFVTLESARDECQLPDRTPLLHFSQRLRDICCTADDPSSGCSCPNCIQNGAIRGIDDITFEILVWRVE